MGQKRPLVFLGIAMIIALATTVMVYRWLQGQRMIEVDTPEVVLEGVSVAVASADIPWGTPLAEKTVRMMTYPEEGVPTGHFKDPASLSGRVVLTNLKKMSLF